MAWRCCAGGCLDICVIQSLFNYIKGYLMQLIKQTSSALAKSITALGNIVVDTAETASLLVGDDGLKTTTRFTMGIVNNSLEESYIESELEKDYNIEQIKKKHKAKVGRPKKNAK